jgi:hypothetical protein
MAIRINGSYSVCPYCYNYSNSIEDVYMPCFLCKEDCENAVR